MHLYFGIMMYTINENVVFVPGALHGAIYDFNTHKVFSVNQEACSILQKLITSEPLTHDELAYITQLKENQLYDPNYTLKPYSPDFSESVNLSLVWLEITQTCNLQCLHCYEGSQHISSKNVLSLSEWMRVIDQLQESKVQRVVVIGGEPCAHKDIKTILRYLAKTPIDITLFTNGTLLDDEIIQIVTKNKMKVKVSLYGHTSEVHDAITMKPGSFNKLISRVRELKQKGVTVDVAVVAMKENQEVLPEIKALIDSLKIPYRGYDVIRNVFGGCQSKHTPDKPEVVAKAKHSKPAFFTTKRQFDINAQRNSCWYGKLAITETGDVIPCVFERTLKYGNVLAQSLGDILASQPLKDNWFRDFSQIEICRDCEFRFACKDCRPLGISIGGNIKDKNPRCLYNPYTGTWGDGTV